MVKMLKIVEKLCGLYGYATIHNVNYAASGTCEPSDGFYRHPGLLSFFFAETLLIEKQCPHIDSLRSLFAFGGGQQYRLHH